MASFLFPFAGSDVSSIKCSHLKWLNTLLSVTFHNQTLSQSNFEKSLSCASLSQQNEESAIEIFVNWTVISVRDP